MARYDGIVPFVQVRQTNWQKSTMTVQKHKKISL